MFEKKKLRMIQELAKEQQHSNENPQENKEYKKKEYRRRNLVSDLKKTIPGMFFTFLAISISYEILKSSVGWQYALMISVPSLILIYMIMWGMISRTYTPPYEKFFVTGHVDPDNTESAIFFEKWMIPKKILNAYLVDGIQFSVMTIEGLMFFCEQLNFDWDTGELKVVFGWPGMDEFNFLLDHGIFHNMKEVIPLLMKKIQNIEANLEVLVHLRAQDMEKDHFMRILHVLLDMTKARSNTDLERYRNEIEKTNREIDLRIRPKKVKDVSPISPKEEVGDIE